VLRLLFLQGCVRRPASRLSAAPETDQNKEIDCSITRTTSKGKAYYAITLSADESATTHFRLTG
jgi:hypothetical protein